MAKKQTLRALTIWQPWASLIVHGRKPVENRMWSPRASELRPGELFAIHAGSRRDEDSWIVARSIARDLAQRGSYDPVPVGINIRTAPYSAMNLKKKT